MCVEWGHIWLRGRDVLSCSAVVLSAGSAVCPCKDGPKQLLGQLFATVFYPLLLRAPSIAADPLGPPVLHFVLLQNGGCFHRSPYLPVLHRFCFSPPFLLFPSTLSLLLPPSVETNLQ